MKGIARKKLIPSLGPHLFKNKSLKCFDAAVLLTLITGYDKEWDRNKLLFLTR